MKEEKKKSTIIINHLVKRTSRIKQSIKDRSITIQLKQNGPTKESLRKVLDKNIKRIGSKPTMKSFQTVISEASDEYILNSSNYENTLNTHKKPLQVSTTNNEQQHHKKLKRIGKKNWITAFKQVIINQQLKNNKNVEEVNQETVITIIKPNQQNNQENPINIIENKNDDQKENNDNLPVNDSQILLTDGDTDSLIFQKAISDEGKADCSRDSFSINVNMVDGKIDTNSAFQKSDRCLQTPGAVKTQSDVGKSNSIILHGELQNLINQQKISYVPSSQNQQDSKIQELIEEIQKNYAKNFQEHQLLQKRKPERDSHFLQIPKGQHRMSDGKYSLYKLDRKKSVQNKQKFEKENIGAIGQKSTLQPRKQSYKSSQSFVPSQKSQQELILESLEKEQYQKAKKLKRNSKQQRISNEGRKSIQKQKTVGNQIKRKSKQVHNQVIKYDNILQQIQQTKEEQYRSESTAKNISQQHYALIKKPLPPAFPQRQKLLYASEGPKKILDENGPKKLVQSISEHVNHSPPKKDLNLSQVQLNEIRIKQFKSGGISSSVHHEKSRNEDFKLKRQSISKKFTNKKLKKTQSILYDVKITTSIIKKSGKPLEPNKCVSEARKILHQSVHI